MVPDFVSLDDLALWGFSGGVFSVFVAGMMGSLKQKQRCIDLVFNASTDGIIVIDGGGKIKKYNRSCENILGYNESEVIDQHIDFLFPPEIAQKSKCDAFVSQCMNADEGDEDCPVCHTVETQAKHKTGRLIKISLKESKCDSNKSGHRMIILRKSNKKDIHDHFGSSLDKSEFLSIMSHELRTPMNGIIGYIDLLEMMELNSEQRKYILNMKEAGRSMTKLIDDMLAFVGIDSGSTELKPEKINIRSFLQAIYDVNAGNAEEKNINISLSFSDNLPDSVTADKNTLRKIVCNTLMAAINFSDTKSVAVDFDWKEQHEQANIQPDITSRGYLVMNICENGDTASGKRISLFEKAISELDQSIDKYTRKFGCSGLEISMVNKITNFLGGSVYSKAMQNGTRGLIIEIPLLSGAVIDCDEQISEENIAVSDQGIKPSHANPDMSISLETVERTEHETPYTGKILLVEDISLNCEIMSAILTKAGHDVFIAENGKKATELLSKESFDIVFMDIQMPIMNGIEATRIIRNEMGINSETLPIIALTAHAFEDEIKIYFENGIDDCMIKPVTPEAMRSKVNMWLAIVDKQKTKANSI